MYVYVYDLKSVLKFIEQATSITSSYISIFLFNVLKDHWEVFWFKYNQILKTGYLSIKEYICLILE